MQQTIVCKSKKDGKDQETIQSSTTPDPGYHIRHLSSFSVKNKALIIM